MSISGSPLHGIDAREQGPVVQPARDRHLHPVARLRSDSGTQRTVRNH